MHIKDKITTFPKKYEKLFVMLRLCCRGEHDQRLITFSEFFSFEYYLNIYTIIYHMLVIFNRNCS